MSGKESKPGRDLERQVADAYRAIGARKVEHDVELAGNQIDVYVEMESADRGLHRIAVEVKDWHRPVGIGVVNEFALVVASLRNAGSIDEGVIVSASGFSRPARNAVQTHGIRLLEIADLAAMPPTSPGVGAQVEQEQTVEVTLQESTSYKPYPVYEKLSPRIRGVGIMFNPFVDSENESVRRLSGRLEQLADYVTEKYLQVSSNKHPEFTFHDEGHSDRVGQYIGQLVSLPCVEPVNTTERFLLLAGAWTHDIGFIVGAREDHNKTSREKIWADEIIRGYLCTSPQMGDAAVNVVAELAYNHSSSVPVVAIEDQELWVQLSSSLAQEKVRLRFLSCLLRLADALDIDARRAIGLEEVLQDLPTISKAYHYCHLRIAHVRVDRKLCQVKVQGMVKKAVDKQKLLLFVRERLKLEREVKEVALPIQRYITDFRDTINYEVIVRDMVREELPECVDYKFLSPTPTPLELFENWKRLHKRLHDLHSMFTDTDGPYIEVERVLQEAKEGRGLDWDRVKRAWENCKHIAYLPTLELVQKARFPEPPLRDLRTAGDCVDDSLARLSFPATFDALREFRAVLTVEFSKVDEELRKIGSEVLARN